MAKAIPNISGYSVDEKGIVYSCKKYKGNPNEKIRVISPSIKKYGYSSVTLYPSRGIRKSYLVHRLVAETFLGDITGKVIDHIDGNPTNNNVTNLRICSYRENSQYQNKKQNNRTGHPCIFKNGRGYRFEFSKHFKSKEEAILFSNNFWRDYGGIF